MNNSYSVYYKFKTEMKKNLDRLNEEVEIHSIRDFHAENSKINKKKLKTLDLDMKNDEDYEVKKNKSLPNENDKKQIDINKLKTNSKNKINISNKNVTIFESDDEDSSSDSDSSYVSSELLKKKNKRNNFVEKDIINKNKPLFQNKKVKNEPIESSSEEISTNKHTINSQPDSNKNQKNENIVIPEEVSKFVNLLEPKQNPPSNINTGYSVSRNNKFLLKEEKIPTNEINFDLINSYMLENIDYLKLHFPTLFEKGTRIVFRIYELSMESGGPAPSGYKKGKIEEYIEDTKYFIIKLDEIDENLASVYSYDIENEKILSVHMKDLIELRVQKSDRNKPETEILIETKNSETESLVGHDSKSFQASESKLAITEKPKQSVFTKILYSQLKKQIEYYFSDKNYYKDQFLLEKARLNEDRCNFCLNKFFRY